MLKTLGLVTFLLAAGQATPASDATWAKWKWLLGTWQGDAAGGKPGTPTASGFSFVPELEGKVLVRRDFTEFPAVGNRPAFKHEGLMVVYPDPRGDTFYAHSYDNEGHVIVYDVTASEQRIVFTSPARVGGPRFRLVYEPEAAGGGIQIRFEIAPPGQPERFETYIEGAAHRTRGP